MSTDGPEIEIYPGDYRLIRGRRNRRHEPPIHWRAVPGFLVFVAIMLWIAACRTVREGYLDPGWFWFLFPSQWHLTGLL